ncbi:hypothetical protein EX30DRAFT_44528 [Ascodesmis nigricans]|uniref:Uncharacterized protein n=1 Tax=Ascodesmis nigricans TaxID=341454 RepID=A0A4S2MW96_9PEZI|nr:hypothetical protein EX30DRAFT_44528 [Ascodesmis nigricans]
MCPSQVLMRRKKCKEHKRCDNKQRTKKKISGKIRGKEKQRPRTPEPRNKSPYHRHQQIREKREGGRQHASNETKKKKKDDANRAKR